ncbi:hypothetical protein Pelo_6863 [Pelomyxa schiedti]|nr:hypothetical protein Pelo_6863 [Pelomyxa schiedti]
MSKGLGTLLVTVLSAHDLKVTVELTLALSLKGDTKLDNVVVSSAAATKSAPTSAPPTSASATATSTDTASASSATTTTTTAAASPPPPPDCRGFLKIRAVFIPAHPVNPSASVCQWEVSVLTADMHNSGTIDELATVQLVGSSAGGNVSSPPMRVTAPHGFPRNSTKSWRIFARDVGAIARVRITREIASESGGGWAISTVTLAPVSASGMLGNAIPFTVKEGSLESTGSFVDAVPTIGGSLSGSTAVVPAVSSQLREVAYTVIIKTGDSKGAGTSAPVSIVLMGTHGKSQQLYLDSPSSDAFTRNHEDTFRVVSSYIGELQRVKVSLATTDPPDTWLLEKMCIFPADSRSPTAKRWFHCGDWLGEVGEKERVLNASLQENSSATASSTRRYKIFVFTGDRRGAGTDANVFIRVFGEAVDSGMINLEGSGRLFSRKGKDEFGFESKNLGEVQKLLICHDNTGFSPSWFLDRVVIGEEGIAGRAWLFPCGRWLSKKEEDGEIERVIAAVPISGGVGDWCSPPLRHYRITTITGDRRGAGTDANVYIVLFGEKGTSPKSVLDGPGNRFERNRADEFGLECPDLAWFLDKVVIQGMEDNGLWYFLCGKWFSKHDDDKQIERTLEAMPQDGVASLPLMRYRVTTVTGDRRGAGTDANVFINIKGEEGKESGKKKLDAAGNCFERAKSDVFGVECEKLGNVKAITIGHDNSGFGGAWFLEKVVVEEYIPNGRKWFFLCGDWISKSSEGGLERELVAIGQDGEASAPMRRYRVEVCTGDRRGAGTDANVYVEIHGEKGVSRRRTLDKAGNCFERKSIDVFGFEEIDLGPLKQLIVGHDNSGFGAAWFLDKVIVVEESSGATWRFFCGNWLSKDSDDHLIERVLDPAPDDGSASRLSCLPLRHYRVIIRTGDRRGAGTDATVYIELVGVEGSSGRRNLDGAGDAFARKKESSFGVECPDVGDLRKIIIGHDNSGLSAGWFLDKVIIREEDGDNAGRETYFLCGRWLADNEDDNQIVREIPARTKDGIACAPLKKYRITTVTGNRRGAGTDANVYVILHGTQGNSAQQVLDGPGNRFERDKSDVFSLECVDLGDVTSLTIGHDNSGVGAAWFLEKVIVQEEPSDPASPAPSPLFFMCRRWLAKNEDDGLIERKLDAIREDGGPSHPWARYIVSTVTGDRRGAGTDANVFVDIKGAEGSTGPRKLEGSGNCFERKNVDKFGIECAAIGDLQSLDVWHDGSGFGSAWFLDKIIVEEEYPRCGLRWFFLCGQWLSNKPVEDETAGGAEQQASLRKTLTPQSTDGTSCAALKHYRITTITGDRRGAGTDANVYITIYGEKGTSPKTILDGPGNLFERNRSDEFGLECVDLGALTKIVIGHDNSGFGASWFLDKVIVQELEVPNTWYFLCGKWLSKHDDDHLIERELPALSTDGVASLPLMRYRVTTVTGDRRGAGTDANIFINLISCEEGKSSGEKKLEAAGNCFERAQSDVFGVECDKLGILKSVIVRNDSSGFGGAWFLEKIIVEEDIANGHKWFFLCGDWLSRSTELQRELVAVAHDGPGSPPLRRYRIAVHTGDRRGAGTDANVYAILHGDKGVSKKYALEGPGNCFERKHVDIFSVQAVDLGPIRKLIIGHDGAGFGSAWFLDKVVVTEENSGAIWNFLCGKWLSKQCDDHLLERELVPLPEDATADARSCVPLRQYTLTVKTGDRRGAGTSANVFIELCGESGTSGQRQLDGPDDPFARGKDSEFGIECPDVGPLRKLIIGHDNSGIGAGWFLDKVIVKEEDGDRAGKETYFLCGRWLADNEDDKQIIRELPGRTQDGVACAPLKRYKVSTVTGNRRGAGTDSNVYIIIHGATGDSAKQVLDGPGNKFERGKTDLFAVECVDLGELKSVTIGHDGTGFGSAWFLEKVIVQEESLSAVEGSTTGKPPVYFMCGRWLGTNEEDGLTERTLPGSSEDGGSSAAWVRYIITTITGDRRGAGTDANVFVDIHGKSGTSGQRKLEGSGNCFERRAKDKFSIECADLGDLTEMEIWHDNSGLGAAWFLDKVIIQEDRPTGRQWFFLCGQWLSKEVVEETENQPPSLKKTLTASLSDGISCPALKHYRVTTVTGDRRGAGTDANVYIIMFGDKAVSPKSKLDGPGNRFERGRADEFGLECADLGSLSKIIIGHDNSGFGASWFLDKVIVQEMEGGGIWYFLCGKWLSKSDDDHLIVRELPALPTDGVASLPLMRYRVTTVTGDRRGAGTDANIFITLVDSEGKNSGEKKLEAAGNCFERAQSDVFGVECEKLGALKSVIVRNDSSGFGGAWFLEKVIVEEDIVNGHKWFFLCGDWLSRSTELQRELVAVAHDGPGSPPLRRYRIAVHTGDRRGAGTDANVYAILHGDKGVSQKCSLDGPGNCFERKHVDVFGVEAPDLGTLTKLIIGHDGTGVGSAWFLDKVIVSEEASGAAWHFLCGKWLSKDSEDHLIERELTPEPDSGAAARLASLPLCHYRLLIHTGDRRGAGTDANVFVELVGATGTSGQKQLDGGGDAFARNKDSVFGVECPDIGELKKLIIGHDNSGLSAGWFLDKVIVKEEDGERAGKESFFLCGRWLADNEDDKQIIRELPARNQDGVACAPLKKYKVTTITGNRRGAGTDANVYVIIHGSLGDSAKQFLDGPGNRFERGKRDIFLVECVDLGELKSVTIGHDGSGLGSAWFLDEVIVQEELSAGPDTAAISTPPSPIYFMCGRWLAKDEEDGATERTLPAILKEGTGPGAWVRYIITTKTGDRKGAGTDANVFVDIRGTTGTSGEKKLLSKGTCFDRKSEDKFGIECESLGDLVSLDIWHDGSGFGSAWFLDKVIVEEDVPTDARKWFFLCGKWLSKSSMDSDPNPSIRKTLVPQTVDGQSCAALKSYTIFVKTGDMRGAGTDSNVYIILHGEKGVSAKNFLDGPGDRFERGRTDEFTLECVDLGPLSKIAIGHDNSGFGGSWYLDKVIVKEADSPAVWYFLCGKWLSKHKDGGLIERELPAMANDGVASLPWVQYKVTTVTGNRRGAGTDANVFVNITGEEEKSTGNKKLEGAGNCFERGKSDVFGFECEKLGELQSLRIWHDNFGIGADWFLDKVIVEELGGKTWVFPCNQWLNKATGLSKELVPTARDIPSASDVRHYRVEVQTGDRRGAGTDAQVYVILHGQKGVSEKHTLDGISGSFERNKLDKFGFEEGDLGPLKKLVIGHDNSGFGPAWFLEKVKVIEEESGSVTNFLCGKWFSKDMEDHLIERELEPSARDGDASVPVRIYRINVFTGDRRGAGTNARVFITLFSATADSGEQQLEARGSGFGRATESSFGIECLELGDLQKIKIRHDNSGITSAWFLDKVIIREEKKGGKEWFFLCGQWLAKGEDDGKIERELIACAKDGTASLPIKHYIVSTYTGNLRGAGTDAGVYISLYGSKGASKKQFLDGPSGSFERNKTDTFGIETVDLGELNRVTIGHDNSGFGAAWYLDRVVVAEEASAAIPNPRSWTFLCQRWFSLKEDDHRIERDLSVAVGPPPPGGSGWCEYTFEIHTSNRRGAGTDANIFIVLYGATSNTGQMFMPDRRKSFQKGSVDIFGIEAPDVGQVIKMDIGHDGKGFSAGWHCEKVIVSKDGTHDKWFFNINKWFDKSEDDHLIVRTINASTSEGASIVPLVNYEVLVVTGQDKKAGTNAHVSCELISATGRSGAQSLDKKKGFKPGDESEFQFEIPDLGELTEVHIWHDNHGLRPGWLLDSITVSTETKEWYFPCGKWLDKKKDGGLLDRRLTVGTKPPSKS